MFTSTTRALTFILKIWDMGNCYQPGTLLVTSHSPAEPELEQCDLANPVYITGADIWVGYQFTQPAIDLSFPEPMADPLIRTATFYPLVWVGHISPTIRN